LSVNLLFELGYFFRKPTISPNYSDVLKNAGADYAKRWQQPGDEKTTDVPSVVYPNNTNRSVFYQYSEALVENGNHIRLQDVRFSYDLSRHLLKGNTFKMLELYVYANNIGIIWRKNKEGIDPHYYGGNGAHILPNPFSLSFGITANL
jgi:hypothetical protein